MGLRLGAGAVLTFPVPGRWELSLGVQELSWVPTVVVDGSLKLARHSIERFQGKNGSMSVGALPPDAAQLSRYHNSHSRGLRPHNFNVAVSENIIVAKRPLHSAPEP